MSLTMTVMAVGSVVGFLIESHGLMVVGSRAVGAPLTAVLTDGPIVRAAEPAPPVLYEAVSYVHPNWATTMLTRVNAHRSAEGLAPLALCPTLGYAADQYSRTMASHGRLLHQAPDGTTAIDRVWSYGFAGADVGENIAAGFTNPSATLRAFMVSTSHRANILNPDHRFAGFGGYDGYWTQYFGSGSTC
jgi:uncharacterized protein YkwD